MLKLVNRIEKSKTNLKGIEKITSIIGGFTRRENKSGFYFKDCKEIDTSLEISRLESKKGNRYFEIFLINNKASLELIREFIELIENPFENNNLITIYKGFYQRQDNKTIDYDNILSVSIDTSVKNFGKIVSLCQKHNEINCQESTALIKGYDTMYII